ncbi:hypothetical protein [Aliirhizobium cellulosilyticum]|uniref:Uncharacterized protein n=1 Tax=Aliirhizobium cellulosilyticum TaxID=393664 RepID=A0A7W6SDT1_9HYPH|nr:hypothetical protein [Rhizobium cellulosilyticum]MBB4351208.1 hypothetical protein [Rhizobium cellulosilyticum]MBB4414216.1 hypothetical protein [Rhizobium cellulosilyticum]MBB4448832.1 hypothetical protein [Rhizobium cellulosilyticum]
MTSLLIIGIATAVAVDSLSAVIQLALEARVAFLDPYRCYTGAYRLR